MAAFTADEAIAVLKRPKDEALNRAVWHEKRLELHTQPTIQAPHNPAFVDLLARVESRIPNDKYKLFVSLMEYPIETVAFTESIFTQIEKIFHSDNAYKKITFKSRDFTEEFEKDIVESDIFYRTEGFDAMKNAINSILIVDLPAEQEGSKPDPYSFLLDIDRVTQIGITSDNFCKYIAYDTGLKANELGIVGEGDKKVISFIDDSAYRLYAEITNEKYVLISENFHDLDYTPAKPFWNEFLARKVDRINKNAPISKQLGMLDQLLFKEVSKEHSDLFTLYPILWNYPEEKDYEDPQSIDYESRPKDGGLYPLVGGGSGVYYNDWTQGVNASGQSYNQKLMGAGRNLESPLPTPDQPAIKEPGGFIEPKVDNLKFIEEDLRIRREEIWITTLGVGGEAKNDQAKNEKQILSGVESRATVLLNIKKNFEIIQKFDLITKAKLIYGPNQIIDCTVNYGTNFFFQTASQMEENIKISEEAGMPWFAIEQQKKDAIKNRYRDNPDQIRRQEILKSISSTLTLFLASKDIFPEDEKFDKVTSALINTFETDNDIKIESIDPELPISGVTTIVFTELLNTINQSNIYGRANDTAERGQETQVQEG